MAAATKKEYSRRHVLQLCPEGKIPKGKNNNSLAWIYSGQRSEDDDGEKRKKDVVAPIKTIYDVGHGVVYTAEALSWGYGVPGSMQLGQVVLNVQFAHREGVAFKQALSQAGLEVRTVGGQNIPPPLPGGWSFLVGSPYYVHVKVEEGDEEEDEGRDDEEECDDSDDKEEDKGYHTKTKSRPKPPPLRPLFNRKGIALCNELVGRLYRAAHGYGFGFPFLFENQTKAVARSAFNLSSETQIEEDEDGNPVHTETQIEEDEDGNPVHTNFDMRYNSKFDIYYEECRVILDAVWRKELNVPDISFYSEGNKSICSSADEAAASLALFDNGDGTYLTPLWYFPSVSKKIATDTDMRVLLAIFGFVVPVLSSTPSGVEGLKHMMQFNGTAASEANTDEARFDAVASLKSWHYRTDGSKEVRKVVDRTDATYLAFHGLGSSSPTLKANVYYDTEAKEVIFKEEGDGIDEANLDPKYKVIIDLVREDAAATESKSAVAKAQWEAAVSEYEQSKVVWEAADKYERAELKKAGKKPKKDGPPFPAEASAGGVANDDGITTKSLVKMVATIRTKEKEMIKKEEKKKESPGVGSLSGSDLLNIIARPYAHMELAGADSVVARRSAAKSWKTRENTLAALTKGLLEEHFSDQDRPALALPMALNHDDLLPSATEKRKHSDVALQFRHVCARAGKKAKATAAAAAAAAADNQETTAV